MIWYLSFLTGLCLAGMIIHPHMAISAWNWLVQLFRNIWAGLHRLGGLLTLLAVLVFILVLAFLHLIAFSLLLWFLVGWTLFFIPILAMQREPAEREEIVEAPRGFGGYVIDDSGGGQSNSSLLVLMKSIEERIEQRPNYEFKESAWGRSLIDLNGIDFDERTDEVYEIPRAIYPREMDI